MTQQTAHAQDAPDSLYDPQDGLPMIVKEVQYFLGYVRYTNQTRATRIVGMTDSEKQALTASRRACVITETFAQHEARTAEHLTVLVWEQEQAAIKEMQDTRRQTALDTQAELSAAIAQKTSDAILATGDLKSALAAELVQLKLEQNTLKIPDVYQMKPIPQRLQAALDNQTF